MIPSIDLVLQTLERALAITVLPAAGNAAAKEEASLGVLFVRWLRDVVDHANDAERVSRRDCREALADVSKLLAGRDGAASRAVVESATELLAAPPAEEIALVREEGRAARRLLARALRAAREDGDVEAAHAVRRRLSALAEREIERERCYGRATGIDSDAAGLPTLAELLARERRPHENERREP